MSCVPQVAPRDPIGKVGPVIAAQVEEADRPIVVGRHELHGRVELEAAGAAGPLLNRLFQTTFSVAKQVRSETAIGASAVSVASAGIQLARRIFSGGRDYLLVLVA